MNEQDGLIINKKRQSNMELLRIISMILIIAHHFSVHGVFNFTTSEITINRLWIQFIEIGGKIGVNIFVLISGYFLINTEKLNISKVLKFWIQVFMYSIGIYLIFVIIQFESFNFSSFIQNFLPITFSCWWFASTYFLLYLIFPYINKLLKCLDKKSYIILLILTTICWSIIPTIFKTSNGYNNLLWFIYLYSLAAYIKLHIKNIKYTSKKCILIAVFLIFLTFLFVIILDYFGINSLYISKHVTDLYGMNSSPILLISLFLFLGFLTIKIKYNKIINIIASATFGVYLIHDNYYMRIFIWKVLFNSSSLSQDLFLIPYSICVIIIVYAICTLIELFRIHAIEKHYIKYINKISNYIYKSKDKFFNSSIFKNS